MQPRVAKIRKSWQRMLSLAQNQVLPTQGLEVTCRPYADAAGRNEPENQCELLCPQRSALPFYRFAEK